MCLSTDCCVCQNIGCSVTQPVLCFSIWLTINFVIFSEKEKLRIERERIERERNELMRMERERQRLERERLEREREELKRQQMR